MSEGDEMDSGTVGSTSTSTVPGSGSSGSSQVPQYHTSMRSNSKEDAFVSASDLSGVLENNRISSNNSESNSNSTTSSSFNNSNSSSAYADNSSSSSSHSGQNPISNSTTTVNNFTPSKSSVSKQDSSSDTTEESGKPMFATCSSTSVSSAATTVRRSESWSVLRSTSFDSSRNGSEADNNEDTKSMASMNDPVVGESQPADTYFTPSTSLHNIVLSKYEKKKSNRLPEGQQLNSENIELLDTDDNDCPQKEPVIPSEEMEEDENGDVDEVKLLLILPHIVVEEEDNEEDIIVDDKSPDQSEDPSASTIMGDLTQSTESNTSKDSTCGTGTKDVHIIKHHKPSGLRGKPTKKKMWYQQIFSASYKSRSGDFKKIFKELPSKERLLVDYSCALQKEILVQGRMYVSQGYLSFHANIFGWETQTSIKLKEITSITKEKTALVIPNAVQVMTDGGEKYFFTSFVTRDSTFLMLFKLWQNALLEDGMPSREIQQLVHSCYGEELVITTDDETEDILSCKSSSVLLDDTSDAGTLLSVCDFVDSRSIGIDPQVCSSDIGPALAVGGSLGTSIITSKSVGLSESDLLHGSTTGAISPPTDLSDSSDSEDEYQAAQGIILVETEAFEIPKCPVQHTEGKETLNAIIPCNIDQLFTMLFTNSKFFLDFHTIRKTFDINQSPWGIGPDGSKKTRQVSFTVTLNAVMGPKHSHLTETQVMLPVSKPGLFYAIDSESVNAGIPYADAFYVTVHYCLSRVSANESKLIVVNQVKYRKSVWGITKSIIEKNCWAGVEEFYAHLERALKEECVKMTLGASPIASPKLTAGSLSRRRPQKTRIKKGPAPGVPVGIPPLICQDGIRNGSIPGAKKSTTMSAVHEGSQTVTEGSFVLKIILSVLACLLLLNAFLYFKLARLETSTGSPIMFPPHAFTFTGEIPQNHQDWLLLLQKQEALHRIELQKWHEILMSALKILNQAELDLEALKVHISTYNGAKYSVDLLKQPSDNSISTSSPVVSEYNHPSTTNSQSESIDSREPNEIVMEQGFQDTKHSSISGESRE